MQAVTEGKDGICNPEIERMSNHLVLRGPCRPTPDRIVAFGGEPIGHGGAFRHVGQRNDYAWFFAHSARRACTGRASVKHWGFAEAGCTAQTESAVAWKET
jgi:hypothetical protein